MKKLIIISILLFGHIHAGQQEIKQMLMTTGVQLVKAAVFPLLMVVEAGIIDTIPERYDFKLTEQESQEMGPNLLVANTFWTAAILGSDALPTEATKTLVGLGVFIVARKALQIKRGRALQEQQRKKDALKK